MSVTEEEIRKAVEEATSVEEVVEEAVEAGEEAVEYSEVEQEAMAHGWRPEGVEGKRNLSAEEFLERGKLIDDIKDLKRKYKKTQEAFDALRVHHNRVKESEREKIIEELKLQKRLALEADDYDRVIEVDEKLAVARATKEEDDDIPDVQREVANEAFVEWSAENRWYSTDADLRERADVIGGRYFEDNPASDLNDVYKYVTRQIKKEYPERFGGEQKEIRKPSTASVDTGSRRVAKTTASTKKYSSKDLPESDFGIMKTLVRAGAITEEQYLKEYFESA